MAVQLLWALILAIGLFVLPESPRYFVKKGNLVAAAGVLERLRDQPSGSVRAPTPPGTPLTIPDPRTRRTRRNNRQSRIRAQCNPPIRLLL